MIGELQMVVTDETEVVLLKRWLLIRIVAVPR